MVAAPAMGLSLTRPSTVWRSYCNALETQPLVTKSITSLVGFALGDMVAQATTRANLRKSKRFDLQRTLRMATFGGMSLGLLTLVILSASLLPVPAAGDCSGAVRASYFSKLKPSSLVCRGCRRSARPLLVSILGQGGCRAAVTAARVHT